MWSVISQIKLSFTFTCITQQTVALHIYRNWWYKWIQHAVFCVLVIMNAFRRVCVCVSVCLGLLYYLQVGHQSLVVPSSLVFLVDPIKDREKVEHWIWTDWIYAKGTLIYAPVPHFPLCCSYIKHTVPMTTPTFYFFYDSSLIWCPGQVHSFFLLFLCMRAHVCVCVCFLCIDFLSKPVLSECEP